MCKFKIAFDRGAAFISSIPGKGVLRYVKGTAAEGRQVRLKLVCLGCRGIPGGLSRVFAERYRTVGF